MTEVAKDDHQKNSPEVEHRLSELDGENEPTDEMRQVADDTFAQAKAEHERAIAMASPVQKVVDGNETAALKTITGLRPVRDMSDAPPPNPLGPHESGEALFEAEQAASKESAKSEKKA